MTLVTHEQIGDLALSFLAEAEINAADADARAAYWQSVSQRQGSELAELSARVLAQQIEIDRLTARLQMSKLNQAQCYCRDAIDEQIAGDLRRQQQFRGHNQ